MTNVEMEKNGLGLIKIKSDSFSTTFEGTSNADIRKFVHGEMKSMKGSFVVAYMDYGVLIGRCPDDRFKFYDSDTFNTKYLQRLRVFNPQEELLLWRCGNGFSGRVRKDDDEIEEKRVVEAHQVLFGTDSSPLEVEGFSEIFEERGTRIILPFKDLNIDIKTDPEKRVFVRTRNYIKNNEAGQATYVDCRFVCFTTGLKDEDRLK